MKKNKHECYSFNVFGRCNHCTKLKDNHVEKADEEKRTIVKEGVSSSLPQQQKQDNYKTNREIIDMYSFRIGLNNGIHEPDKLWISKDDHEKEIQEYLELLTRRLRKQLKSVSKGGCK